MNQARIFKVLLGPHFTEKATSASASANQVVFKVATDATKPEIKAAVEQLFEVKVLGVSVALMKGKTKQSKHGLGRRSNWKKAYVRLEQGQEIDFASAE
jgi:large subunit ribosomal protein L23|tara:strand:+ start:1201 stop:1497 length:297 start_codon:yes stop_codon:yes gene_type:complete